jgi:diacylglycerol kinase
MLHSPEKIPVLAKAKDMAPSAAFFGLALLAMAGWMYLLSTFFLKFVFWCIS